MPQGNPKISEFAKKFSSTYQPAKNGRRPKLYTMAKKGYNLGIDEFRDIVSWLMQLPREQLKRISEDDLTPIWMVTVCRALYKDAGNGKTSTLNELTERLWGKSTQKVDMTTNGKEIVQEPIIINRVSTKEEIQAQAAEGQG